MDSATRNHPPRDKACERCAELAHDVNNFLAVILGSCELLAQQPALSRQAQEIVSRLLGAATSARNLSENALALLRQQPLSTAPLDLNQLVDRLEAMLRLSIGEQIELVSILSAKPAIIHAIPSEVEQVLMNLVVNARDAMPQGGKITIETAGITNDGLGRCLMLAVTDTGMGMDAKTQAHIFERLFTTKAGKGTGLGLSIVSKIVERAGWAITVDSSPRLGTTFKIYFPSYEECSDAVVESLHTSPQQETETILLLEDCDSLRKLTRRLLEDRGYQVLDAASSTEALRVARKHRGPIALLIADLSVPGLSGAALGQKFALLHPQTRVLYTSGYNDGSLGAEHQGAFLQKPFTRDDLLKKVRELLDAQQPARRSALPPKATFQHSSSRYSAHRLCG